MTQKELILLLNYVRGAYQTFKSDANSDAVWYDLLQGEEYYGILQALKNYIRKGNKFPPTPADLIMGYELIVLEFSNEVLRLMESAGYFDDPTEIVLTEKYDELTDTYIKTEPRKVLTDLELARWNKDNRKRRAYIWLSEGFPKEAIPKWFKEDYQKYEKMIKAKYFALSSPEIVRALS